MKKTIRKIAILSILMALGIILKSFLSIGDGEFRISFWDIPLFLAGIIGGPIWGGIVSLGTDLIYGLCFSPFPFSFIMMFTTIVWGVAGGVFKYIKLSEKKLWLLFLVILGTAILATLINSFYLTLYNGFETMLVKLPLRTLVMLIKWPITTMLIFVIYESILPLVNKYL